MARRNTVTSPTWSISVTQASLGMTPAQFKKWLKTAPKDVPPEPLPPEERDGPVDMMARDDWDYEYGEEV